MIKNTKVLLNKDCFTIAKLILTNKELVSDTLVPEKKIVPTFLQIFAGQRTKVIKEHWVLKNYNVSVSELDYYQLMTEQDKLFSRAKLYLTFTDNSYIAEYFDTDDDMLKRVEVLKNEYNIKTVEFKPE